MTRHGLNPPPSGRGARQYEDMTEKEVAAMMGCTVGTVKSQTAKALGKLRVDADLCAWPGQAGRMPADRVLDHWAPDHWAPDDRAGGGGRRRTGAEPAASAQATLAARLHFLGVSGSVAVSGAHLQVRAPIPTAWLSSLENPA
jgi:hypothetical protein